MTFASVRFRREALARARVDHHLDRLKLELAMGAPRRYLDPLVELLELLVEQTGTNLYTAGYRRELAALKQRVEARVEQPQDHHLRLVTGAGS